MGTLNAIPGVSLTPSVDQVILPSNYISYYDYTTQYSPDTKNELVRTYGNQQITGLLRAQSNESSFESDIFYWGEEGRLHTNYNTVTRSGTTFTQADHVFRLNEMIQVSDASAVKIGVITSIPDKDTFVMAPYEASGFTALGTVSLTAYKIGTEYKQGIEGNIPSLEKKPTVRSNSPIIHRTQVTTSGSNIASVSWIQTDGGYSWFLQNEKDEYERFEDHAEMLCLLGQAAEMGSGANTSGYKGTEGLFDVVERRGNLYNGTVDTIAQWDEIVTRLDAQGKIRDYMIYCDRAQSVAIDDMLGALNAGYSGGISFGIFENAGMEPGKGEQTAVNLGFKGFTRSGYNIFKNDYKLLNEVTLLGSVDPAQKIRSIMIPYGTEEVYDAPNGNVGTTKHRKPFLEMKYRGNQFENRRLKTWTTGSAYQTGQPTSTLDAREVNFLTERMLCVNGAENFILGKGV